MGCQRFTACSVEQVVTIIRTIVEHRWPMMISEAFSLRDQFGWRPTPDDETIFTTPVSAGEEDGYICNDVTNGNLVSRVGFNLSTRFPSDAPPEIQVAVQNSCVFYVNAFNSLYGAGDSESDQGVASTQWILSFRASVIVAATRGPCLRLLSLLR